MSSCRPVNKHAVTAYRRTDRERRVRAPFNLCPCPRWRSTVPPFLHVAGGAAAIPLPVVTVVADVIEPRPACPRPDKAVPASVEPDVVKVLSCFAVYLVAYSGGGEPTAEDVGVAGGGRVRDGRCEDAR